MNPSSRPGNTTHPKPSLRVAMKMLTVGKNERRNDDFVYAQSLFEGTGLGIIGDFTGDGPKGVNGDCVEALDVFVKARIQTWRELLLPADRILLLIARYLNQWLADYGRRAQTTLIAWLWDVVSGRCHFLSVGDSGLAVVGPQGLRFLAEGDRSGIRIAAGFLPSSNEFRVQKAAVGPQDVLFAFTDGLWENTQTFLNDRLLETVFRAGGLNQIIDTVNRDILQPAVRKDDLSMLIMKGEPMFLPGHDSPGHDSPRDENPGSKNQNDQAPSGDSLYLNEARFQHRLQEEVNRQLDQTVGAGLAHRAPSPVEQHLLDLVADAPQLEARLSQTLSAKLNGDLQELIRARIDQLAMESQQRENLRRQEMAAFNKQMDRIDARLGDLSVGLKDLRTQAESPRFADHDKRLDRLAKGLSKLRTDVSKAHREMGLKAATIPHDDSFPRGFRWPLSQIWTFSLGALIVLGFVVWFFLPNIKSLMNRDQPDNIAKFQSLLQSAETAYQEQDLNGAVAYLQDAKMLDDNLWNKSHQYILDNYKQALVKPPPRTERPVTVPNPPPNNPVKANFKAAPIGEGVLNLMGLQRKTYQDQTAALFSALSNLKKPITLPGSEVVPLPKNLFKAEAFTVTLYANSSWIQENPIPAPVISKLWFQNLLGLPVVDSKLGDGTKKAFVDQYAARIKARQGLGAQLKNEATPPADLDKTLVTLFGTSQEKLQADLLALAGSLKKAPERGQYSMSQHLDRPMAAVLSRGDEPTRLGQWVEKHRDIKPLSMDHLAAAIRILWLASKLGLNQTDGTADKILMGKLDPFSGKSAEVVFREMITAWKSP